MAKEKNNNLKIGEDIIAALSVQAAESVEGLHVLTSDGKKSFDPQKSVQVYFLTPDKVSIDIFLNAVYGYNVPEVVCQVQDKIKTDVEGATKYKVAGINVKIVNVLF